MLTARRRADVELLQGACTHHPVALQRVIKLEALDGRHQGVVVGVVRGHRKLAQVALTEQTLRQGGHPRILHARSQQRPFGNGLPLRQRQQALTGVYPAQVLVGLERGTRPGKGLFDVVQAGAGDRQQWGLAVRGERVGMPHRLEALLRQPTVMQIVQGLQVLMADLDVGTHPFSGR